MALLVGILAVTWIARRGADELHRFRSGDPTVWESAIVALEREEAESPQPGAIALVGASTIRFWETAPEDFAPLSVVRRGFGGAKLADIDHYAERLVTPAPRVLVLSIGGNDLFEFAGSDATPAEEVAAATEGLIRKFRALLPGVPIYYVSIRPPILDAQGRDPASKVNARVRVFAQNTQGVEFIDANVDMYDERGEIKIELMEAKGSRLSRAGYVAWARPIREKLLADFESPELVETP